MRWSPVRRIEVLASTWEVLTSEKVSIAMYGGPEVGATFRRFTAPHRLVPFLQRKSWGAALLCVPEAPELYLVGSGYELVRRKRKKALRAGYAFRRVSATEHAHEMLAINRSAGQRQGKSMHPQYLDQAAVMSFCESIREVYGVFDGSGRMVAYAHAPMLGDVFCFSRLLGDARTLDDGTMYLLITEVVLDKMRLRGVPGAPLWAMYDMYWGGRAGLREFKRRLGFRPYRVTWLWRDTSLVKG
jgi:hypothetical protein